MLCPKCGQVTVHINDKEICTRCGIVFDDSLPREQVVGQLRSRAAEQAAGHQEKYISPIALAKKPAAVAPPQAVTGDFRSAPAQNLPTQTQAGPSFSPTPAPSQPTQIQERTVEQVQRDAKIQIMAPQAIAAPSQPTIQQPVIPQATTQTAPAEPTVTEQAGYARTANDSGVVFVNFPEMQAETQSQLAAPAFKTDNLPPGNAYLISDTQPAGAVYPSNQVNPLLARGIIAAVSIFILIVLTYLIFANLGFLAGIMQKFTEYLGGTVFK